MIFKRELHIGKVTGDNVSFSYIFKAILFGNFVICGLDTTIYFLHNYNSLQIQEQVLKLTNNFESTHI